MKKRSSISSERAKADVPGAQDAAPAAIVQDDLRFRVIVIPFPYADSVASKRRPAVILSADALFHQQMGCVVAAMITSSSKPWPHDVRISDAEALGLQKACAIRLKLFTLDTRLIVRTLGTLSPKDQKAVKSSLHRLLG